MMNKNNESFTRHTITISYATLMKLKKSGIFGESYSQLINRLVDVYENKKVEGR
jgi:hypothetical protein